MQIPKRKPGKYTGQFLDPHLTQEKFDELTKNLDRLKKIDQPRAIAEVEELAKLGDFSENAAYQIAKGKMRGINQRILEIEDHLNQAVIIEPSGDMGRVQLGSRVTITMNDREITYLILGPSETDPAEGIISHQSPLGAALMGHRVGDVVTVGDKNECTIVKVG